VIVCIDPTANETHVTIAADTLTGLAHATSAHITVTGPVPEGEVLRFP
jgi:hypothetical protein